MLTDEERERRTGELVDEIRRRQYEMQHPGPTPAFLGWMTERAVEWEHRLELIEERLDAIERRHDNIDDQEERAREH